MTFKVSFGSDATQYDLPEGDFSTQIGQVISDNGIILPENAFPITVTASNGDTVQFGPPDMVADSSGDPQKDARKITKWEHNEALKRVSGTHTRTSSRKAA